MTLTLATWNINSVRIRLHALAELIAHSAPDVICLQEIKCETTAFPYQAVAALGYPYAYVHGQKGYHGVAIISKTPLEQVATLSLLENDGSRHIAVKLADGTEIHNFYVPAGGDIPDRVANPYYGFKLDYVEAMEAWFTTHRKPAQPMILVGDLNIAPMEHDVWSHKQLLKVVSHTPQEIERLQRLYASGNWQDAARHFTAHDEKLYSWWSYRNRDWKVANRGRRLDHIWLTPPASPRLKACNTLTFMRDLEKTSDHVPVVVRLQT